MNNIPTLKKAAQMLMTDHRPGTSFALSKVLDRLEELLPEADFIRFCDSL